MAVIDWIDTVCRLWEFDDMRGGTVRSYRVYEVAEFPDSISVFPCALTYTDRMVPIYTASLAYNLWTGVTEFHITPNVDKSNFPLIMRYFNSILVAAAGSMKLGGLVDHFKINLDPGSGGIVGPRVMEYGSEEPHLGVLVYWEVKESVSGLSVVV